jgi:hypothetical protein
MRQAACAVLLAALGWLAPAQAAPALADLQVALDRPLTGSLVQPSTLVVSGRAPARCTPELGQTLLEDDNLSIELRVPAGCEGARQSRFALRVAPDAIGGVPLLPAHVYRVRLYAGSGGTATLVGFVLLDTHPATAAAVPESGFWWSQSGEQAGPALRGSGASLEWQDGQLAVGVFGFADAGDPTWYFGSGRPAGRTAAIDLVHLDHGDPLFSPPTGQAPEAQAGPRLLLEFLSPVRANAWLLQGGDGQLLNVRTLALARSGFATGTPGSDWRGQWVLVGDDTAPPRLFEFGESSSHDALAFHLDDAAQGVALDCRSGEGTALPRLCSLTAGTLPLADFDQVGLDRMTGRDATGARVSLLRVPR